jgi:hypothetical protein
VARASRRRRVRGTLRGVPEVRRRPQERPAADRPTEQPPAEQPAAGQGPLDALVERWLTVPDVADHLGVDVTRVRRMLDDGLLAGVRRGSPRVFSVPAALVEPEPLDALPGTLTVLADAGFERVEALRWLFTPDPSLPGTPVEALRAGRKTEVRRRAQSLAF